MLALCTTPFILPSGEAGEYTFHLTASDLSTAAAAYEAYTVELSTATAYKAAFPTSLLFSTGTVREIDVATGTTIATAVAGTAYACTGGTEALPPQCSMAVTLRTALSGRSYRGRFYHPATTYLDLTAAGRLQSATCDALVAALGAALNSSLVDAGGTLVVYSRTKHLYTTVTAVEIGDVIDTQRRRRDGLAEARHSYAF